jgi:excisionase family DNA binding protein
MSAAKQTAPAAGEVLKKEELSRLLRIGRYAIERNIDSIPHVRVGRRVLFPRRAIEAWLAAGGRVGS